MANKQMAKQLTLHEIEARRHFASKAEDLCNVVKTFDGKVFNKRLETAMRKIYPVTVENGFAWKSIKITGWINSEINHNKIFFGSVQDALDNDKHIIAENLIQRIREIADYYRKTADQMDAQIRRIDEIIAECNRIYAERQKFIEETSPIIREYFGLEL